MEERRNGTESVRSDMVISGSLFPEREIIGKEIEDEKTKWGKK